jgi:hypothetical protein
MKYAVEMGSGAMVFVPSVIKIGSGILKLIGVIHGQNGDRVSLHLFFQNEESRMKRKRVNSNTHHSSFIFQ